MPGDNWPPPPAASHGYRGKLNANVTDLLGGSDSEPEAAVDQERLAGGIAGRDEREAGLGDVLGSGHAVQRRGQLDAGLAIVPLLSPWSRDQAWRDGVHAHPAASVLSHDRGQVTHSSLGHRIRQGTADLPYSGQRGDVDDPAVAGAA